MDKKFNKNWNYGSYTYNDYHFTDVKSLPRKDKKRLKNDGLTNDDVAIYREGRYYNYEPFDKKAVQLLNHDGFLNLSLADLD